MKWTNEQESVINLRDRNILVSAAAGSGKTAVLVERIIKKITSTKHPVDIDKLLVVTFTNAAAAEMKERIGRAIDAQLELNNEDENLRRQQTLIHNAQITTIDSFCLFVVRNHFQEIGLEPSFRIADQGELKLLEMDVLQEIFEKEYENGRHRFLTLVNAYSNKKSNQDVKDMVHKIYSQSLSSPWPREWIRSLAFVYQVQTIEELLSSDVMKGIFSYVKELLYEMQFELTELKKVALEPDGPAKYAVTLEQDLAMFEGLDDVETYEQLKDFVNKINFARIATIQKKDILNELKKQAVQDRRTEIKNTVNKINEQYFSMSLDELLAQLHHIQPMVEELVHLALTYEEAMQEEKQRKKIMDFSDIEHAALRIFVDENTKKATDTARQFRQQYEEIMIDEYQDSNQVQEEIMRAISREEDGAYNMFMVGDVKQSIYRFRLARPELFMEKFDTYDLCESTKQRIDLHKNFRSRQEVLDFTNDVFFKIMGKDLGNVGYDAKAALYYGADYKEATDMDAEVLLYEAKVKKGASEEDVIETGDLDADTTNKRQLEAYMIAKRIKELKETMQVTDKKTNELRMLRNSDIVILLRGLKDWGNDFVKVLADCGIDAYVATSTGYFSAMEVQTVLSFLKILDNPYQDIPMAAVLKSQIVGLDDEELAEVAITGGARSFAEAVLMQMKESTNEKLGRFASLYERLRKMVYDTPIHQLIGIVLEETGYGDYVKALPAGTKRRANLDMLIEKAIAYEKTSYKGLFHFVRYIDLLQKYEIDYGEADVIAENEDVVRIMTIHKSKGLEFPVVFVSGLGKKFNERDVNNKLALHPDMGIGLDERFLEPKRERKCFLRTGIAERIRRDNLGEELRVLYVALTRAKEKLILTGTVDDEETLYKKYTGNVKEGKTLSFSQRSSAKKYIDWVAPAVLSYPDKYHFSFENVHTLILEDAKQKASQMIAKQTMLEKIESADEALVEELITSFSYQYPYQYEEGRKSKYSVSEIKHAAMVQQYDREQGEAEVPDFLVENKESYIPAFAREDGTDAAVGQPNRGALRGTAVHRVMECLSFSKILEQEDIDAYLTEELARMLDKRLITQEMCDLVNMDKIKAFLKSDITHRMALADARGDLYKEKPFVMDYDGALLQGIIDVFWIEEDRIVVLDYKTDYVQTSQELIDRYKTQLNLYANALARIFAKNYTEGAKLEEYIYSFRLGEVIPLHTETE